MIEVIQGLPAHVTAFRATGIVTRDGKWLIFSYKFKIDFLI